MSKQLIVIDDVNSKEILNGTSIQKIAYNGRHYRISLMMCGEESAYAQLQRAEKWRIEFLCAYLKTLSDADRAKYLNDWNFCGTM